MSKLRIVVCVIMLSLVALSEAAKPTTTTAKSSSSSSSSEVYYYPGLVNTKIDRVIDIRTHIEEVTCSIDVENTGTQFAEFYIFPIYPTKLSHLAIISANTKSSTLKTTLVNIKGIDSSEKGTGYVKIDFDAPLAPKGTFSFQVKVIYTRVLRPFPAEISQSDNQLVEYYDNLYVYSAYTTQEQQTTAKLASSKIESFTKTDATEKGDTIEYGPFNATDAFQYESLHIHYENNSPFITMTSMTKLIELSLYGNINVEEWYMLEHTGAKLKGSFSRYEYQRNSNAKGASFRQITAALPLHASDLYYRDQIGNISTSHVRETEDSIQFEVLPRFPMFGGWKTDFYIGYNLPANEYLSIDSDSSSTYLLNISFGSPFSQAAIDEEEIRVILPEFSSNIKWVTPFEVDSESRQVHVTYLDTVGRPVLVLKKKNVVNAHNQPFQVMFTFSKVYMFQEPLILFFAFMLFFLAAMVYVRIDLSITDSAAVVSSLRSQRQGRAGQIINKILTVSGEALVLLETISSNNVEHIHSLFKQLKPSFDDLRKEDLGEIVERMENIITQIKNISRKYTQGTADQAEKEKSKLQSKVDDLQNVLTELARI